VDGRRTTNHTPNKQTATDGRRTTRPPTATEPTPTANQRTGTDDERTEQPARQPEGQPESKHHPTTTHNNQNPAAEHATNTSRRQTTTVGHQVPMDLGRGRALFMCVASRIEIADSLSRIGAAGNQLCQQTYKAEAKHNRRQRSSNTEKNV
jgi:hypothetical protein